MRRENARSSRPRSTAVAAGKRSRSTSSRSTRGSTGTPASRRISRPRAWKVRTRTEPASAPSGPIAASSRSASSTAARLLKATRQIEAGSVPPSTSQATRATSVVVLPLPAGATTSTGPGGAVAAARWSGASRARRSVTEGWQGRGTPRSLARAAYAPLTRRRGRSGRFLRVRWATARRARRCSARHVRPAANSVFPREPPAATMRSSSPTVPVRRRRPARSRATLVSRARDLPEPGQPVPVRHDAARRDHPPPRRPPQRPASSPSVER